MRLRALPLTIALALLIAGGVALGQMAPRLYLPTVTNGPAGPQLAGCPVLPADNPWNQDISGLAAHPGSDAFIASISAGGDGFLHADFGEDQSYGIPLQMQHDLMLRALDRVAEAAARHGKWWGLPVGSAEVAARYHEQGARFFACGAAVIILQRGFRQIREEFAPLLGR